MWVKITTEKTTYFCTFNIRIVHLVCGFFTDFEDRIYKIQIKTPKIGYLIRINCSCMYYYSHFYHNKWIECHCAIRKIKRWNILKQIRGSISSKLVFFGCQNQTRTDNLIIKFLKWYQIYLMQRHWSLS